MSTYKHSNQNDSTVVNERAKTERKKAKELTKKDKRIKQPQAGKQY